MKLIGIMGKSGSGKTTLSGKLALKLKKEGNKEAKCMLNFPIGYYQRTNPLFRAYVVNSCNEVISSIMNDNVAINYRTIYNGYPLFSQSADFTEYSDYERCVMKDKYLAAYLQDKKNPTYKNIIKYYSSEDFDPFGLARYKMQDFIYLKYYN